MDKTNTCWENLEVSQCNFKLYVRIDGAYYASMSIFRTKNKDFNVRIQCYVWVPVQWHISLHSTLLVSEQSMCRYLSLKWANMILCYLVLVN